MVEIQKRILAAMGDGERLHTAQIASRLSTHGIVRERQVIYHLCVLRGTGYVTDGRSGVTYKGGVEVWRTPSEFAYRTGNEPVEWLKLPARFAASATGRPS